MTCISKEEMQDETTNDKLLSKILSSLQASCPRKADLVKKALAFYMVHKDPSKIYGMLLRGECVVPEKLRLTVLDLVHDSHPGTVQIEHRL